MCVVHSHWNQTQRSVCEDHFSVAVHIIRKFLKLKALNVFVSPNWHFFTVYNFWILMIFSFKYIERLVIFVSHVYDFIKFKQFVQQIAIPLSINNSIWFGCFRKIFIWLHKIWQCHRDIFLCCQSHPKFSKYNLCDCLSFYF